ncbi:MAG: DUF4278 domain-containing protein [Pelatocladus maniniholoensis HA4357-MV3]|uniref:DUF4278 domain-containing protein n=1 Tax=Pelatocladus maniniholoensis HA4357-MV3 TaxID=1117104 RepID=A0A9E3H6C9_9NOST|nr:DUF4278 domain-containing protein [Pelatocladus maniniholoensis HA4357-MV3]BAZ66379.1 hypothetical protein NIES4106_11300 [Fischerella sp. NIES-4106]
MHLSYRGVRYHSQATQIPTLDNTKKGFYRGAPYNINQVKSTTVQQCLQLKYRGINYKNCLA